MEMEMEMESMNSIFLNGQNANIVWNGEMCNEYQNNIWNQSPKNRVSYGMSYGYMRIRCLSNKWNRFMTKYYKKPENKSKLKKLPFSNQLFSDIDRLVQEEEQLLLIHNEIMNKGMYIMNDCKKQNDLFAMKECIADGIYFTSNPKIFTQKMKDLLENYCEINCNSSSNTINRNKHEKIILSLYPKICEFDKHYIERRINEINYFYDDQLVNSSDNDDDDDDDDDDDEM